MSKSRLPKDVRVGNHVYSVSTGSLSEESGLELYGKTTFADLAITLDADNCKHRSLEQDTALHEVLHAIFADGPILFDEDTAQEESVIRALAPALITFMRNNTNFIHYLIEE